jgi:hypothetical protein
MIHLLMVRLTLAFFYILKVKIVIQKMSFKRIFPL